MVETQRGKVVRKVKAKRDEPLWVAMSGDGRRLALHRSGEIQITDIDSGERLFKVPHREAGLVGLKLSRDGSVLLASHLPGQVRGGWSSGNLGGAAGGGFGGGFGRFGGGGFGGAQGNGGGGRASARFPSRSER